MQTRWVLHAMTDKQFIDYFIESRNLNRNPTIVLTDFARQAIGDQSPTNRFLTTAVNNWPTRERRFDETCTEAIQWLANNWNRNNQLRATSTLTIVLPEKITITSPIVFNSGCKFSLTNGSFDIKGSLSAFNNCAEGADSQCAVTFNNTCNLNDISFSTSPRGIRGINLILIDNISNNETSVIEGCGFEGFKQSFGITSLRGNLSVDNNNFKSAPAGTSVRFLNTQRNHTPDLFIGRSGLFHIGQSSLALSIGNPGSITSRTLRDLGDITIEQCTWDLGGRILDARFSSNTSVGNLKVQYCNFYGHVKSTRGIGKNIAAISIQEIGNADVEFSSIQFLDNCIATLYKDKTLAAIYIPDKVKVTGLFTIKGITTVEGSTTAFPIVISNNLVKSRLKICGIVTNYNNEALSGLAGIGRKKGSRILSLTEDDKGASRFEVAG